MVAMPIWSGWPRGILPPFLTSFYGNGRTKFPKKKLNDDSRRGNTKIGQFPPPREQAAQIQKLSVQLDSNNLLLVVNTSFGENGTLEPRNSARIAQSLDSWLVL
jgi:hypothetical protein